MLSNEQMQKEIDRLKGMEAVRDREHCQGEPDRQQNPRIESAFTYHAPKPGQPELYAKIRERAKALAYLIEDTVPDSREKSLAMTKLEEAVMWANAGIARN